MRKRGTAAQGDVIPTEPRHTKHRIEMLLNRADDQRQSTRTDTTRTTNVVLSVIMLC